MDEGKKGNVWERTNVTNLLRNGDSGTYYARVKVGNKQKWRSLKTDVFSVAKLRLGDAEKEMRSHASTTSTDSTKAGGGELMVSRFIAVQRARIEADTELSESTKVRRAGAIKTLEKSWPELPGRDIRRVTTSDCQGWAAALKRTGTGSDRTHGKPLSPSGFNKLIDELRAVFAIAQAEGIIYKNPAGELGKIPPKQKRLVLPSASQFAAIVAHIAASKTRWSAGCVELVKLLAYSGVRIEEGRSLQWRHVNFEKNELTVPGTKSETSDRIIPLFPSLAQLLKEVRAARIQVNPADHILEVGSGFNLLAAACAAVGVPKLTHHDLRHLFATRCIESGIDIPTVSRWLGHADGGALAMRTYGHLRQEHSQAQASKVIF